MIKERYNMDNLEMDFCSCCNEKLMNTDLSDIVFCPDCGTPVHRHCWNENGGCPNSDKHGTDFVWKSNSEKERERIVAAELEREKNSVSEMDSEDEEMEQLNHEIEQLFFKIREENNPDEPVYMGVSERELKSFLNVRTRQSVYRFALLRSIAFTGKKMSVNVFSGFLMPFYQFYKGMLPLGVLLTVVQVIVAVPQMIFYYSSFFISERFAEFIQTEQFSALLTTASWISFTLTVLLCLFGDYLYLVSTVKKIKRIRTEFVEKPEEEYYEALREAGASKPIRILVAVALEFFLLGVCLLVIQAFA